MSYKIGSFNCLNFGMGASKDIDKFVQIIKKYDIIALQEIKNKEVIEQIKKRLPSYWDGIADDGYVADYAFIWNTRKFELAHTIKDGKKKIYEPRIYKQYKVDRKNGQKDLVREPFYARFYPINGPFIELRLINTHIRYSKGKSDTSEDEQTLGAIAMRKNEYDVLLKNIYAKEDDKVYGDNRTRYTILLGDYNLNMPSSTAKSPYLVEEIIIQEREKIKRIRTLQSDLSTLKKPSDNQDSKEEMNYFSNNYDHITIDAERFSGTSWKIKRHDTVKKFYDGDYEEHIKNISDHTPIEFEIDLRERG